MAGRSRQGTAEGGEKLDITARVRDTIGKAGSETRRDDFI